MTNIESTPEREPNSLLSEFASTFAQFNSEENSFSQTTLPSDVDGTAKLISCARRDGV
jgi:hypothetical protein